MRGAFVPSRGRYPEGIQKERLQLTGRPRRQAEATLKARLHTIQTKPPQQASDNISLTKRGMASSNLATVLRLFYVLYAFSSSVGGDEAQPRQSRGQGGGVRDWVLRKRLARKNSTVRGLSARAWAICFVVRPATMNSAT